MVVVVWLPGSSQEAPRRLPAGSQRVSAPRRLPGGSGCLEVGVVVVVVVVIVVVVVVVVVISSSSSSPSTFWRY